jgi:hypothetical protein
MPTTGIKRLGSPCRVGIGIKQGATSGQAEICSPPLPGTGSQL